MELVRGRGREGEMGAREVSLNFLDINIISLSWMSFWRIFKSFFFLFIVPSFLYFFICLGEGAYTLPFFTDLLSGLHNPDQFPYWSVYLATVVFHHCLAVCIIQETEYSAQCSMRTTAFRVGCQINN